MGADLYIKSVHDPLLEKYQPLFDKAVRHRDALPNDSKEREAAQREVEKYYELMYAEGYFRDSYNSTNVLWTLGLSWWRDVVPLLNKHRELTGENPRRFRDRVAVVRQCLPTKEKLEERGARVGDTGENSVEAWHQYFVEKRAKLLVFLDAAIELETGIYSSL
jgi:hypothetical protein